MIKKYSITKEKFNRLYPIPVGLSSSLTLGRTAALRSSSDFPIKDSYALCRATPFNYAMSTEFYSSKMGIYEMPHLRQKHDYRYFIIPVDEVQVEEVEGLYEQFKPVLDKLMPGRYFHTSCPDDETITYLYLYYPEITIRNSIGEEHLIKDMVVRLELTASGIVPSLYGKRFSYTRKELECRYTHSHLHTDVISSNDFSPFCIGDNSSLRTYMRGLNSVCVPDQFELLLVQIEQFLAWESIEGKPYISISTLFTSQRAITRPLLSNTRVDRIAREFIAELTNEMLFQYNNDTYIINTAIAGDLIFELEKKITDSLLAAGVSSDFFYDFDIEAKAYVNMPSTNNSSTSVPVNLVNESTYAIRHVFNIVPKLYETKEPIQRKSIIKRLGTLDLQEIFITINKYLTYSHKINGQSNIAIESEGINNSKATVSDNSTA